MVNYEIITVVIADVGRRLHAGVETEAKPARSAPSYADMLPKYREVAHDIISVHDKKIHTVSKFYEPDVAVVEARSIITDLFSKDVLELKKSMLNVCVEIAQKRDHFAEIYEEYTIYCVSGYKFVNQFYRQKAHIVGLMRNEVEEMDKDVVESAWRESSIKYSSNDLVVVGWDSAILFSDDFREFPEMIEVLIVGNIQLLQLRLLNKELEDGLESVKNLLAKLRMPWFKLRTVLQHIIELRTTSLFELEKTKANINLLGDWYTATLYALTAKKFHLDEKMVEVSRRLEALEEMYEMITERLNSSYMLLLELLITVLIVFEIVMAFI